MTRRSGSVRVRLAFIASTLRRTGPTRQLANLCAHLDRDRFEPVVCTLSEEPADSMKKEFYELNVDVVCLNVNVLRAFLPFGMERRLLRAIGACSASRVIVHSQGIRPDFLTAFGLKRLIRLTTARNYPFDDYPAKFGAFLGQVMSHVHLMSLRTMPTVVGCSDFIVQKLRGRGISSRLVHNGVDTSRFAPASVTDKIAARRALGIDKDAIVVISVGALSSRKDPLTILQAVNSLDNPDLVLLLVGDGILMSDCRNWANGDCRIKVTGSTDDVSRYLQAADAFVSASYSEGYPNSVLEAIASGLIVLLSGIPSHEEVLSNTGAGGSLFPVGNSNALAASIDAFIRYGGSGVSAESRDRVSALAMSRRYQTIYDSLAGAEGEVQ